MGAYEFERQSSGWAAGLAEAADALHWRQANIVDFDVPSHRMNATISVTASLQATDRRRFASRCAQSASFKMIHFLRPLGPFAVWDDHFGFPIVIQ
jgi:hypothetical protein